MSTSESQSPAARAVATDVEPLIEQLRAATEGIGLDGAGHDLSAESVDALMTMAVRLYSATLTTHEAGIELSAKGVSTTEAVSAISALMHAQDLNTFDLALWQSKLRRS